MTRTFQFIASVYVALCLAFAGTVGLSPTLHRLVEHGGQGLAHTHRGGWDGPAPHATTETHSHPHPDLHKAAGDSDVGGTFFAHNYRPFALPRIPWHHLWHVVVGLVGANDPVGASGSGPADQQPHHEHHSLAQMLATGAVEQSLDLPWLGIEVGAIHFSLVTPRVILLEFSFEAPTAGRGPPRLRS